MSIAMKQKKYSIWFSKNTLSKFAFLLQITNKEATHPLINFVYLLLKMWYETIFISQGTFFRHFKMLAGCVLVVPRLRSSALA